MDILIDLIIYIIKATAKSRQPQQRVTPPSQQEIDRQKAEVEKRIREMQTALAQQTGQPAPGKQIRRVKRAVQPPPLPLPASKVSAPRWTDPEVSPVSSTPQRATAPLTRQRFVVPLLLGEILAPPLALREMEF